MIVVTSLDAVNGPGCPHSKANTVLKLVFSCTLHIACLLNRRLVLIK